MDQALRAALEQLTSLRGVRHASFARGASVFHSSLPTEGREPMLGLIEIFAQLHASLQSIGKNHNELFLEFEDEQLVAYAVGEGVWIVLNADKRVNVPMIGMAVRSVADTVRAACLRPPAGERIRLVESC